MKSAPFILLLILSCCTKLVGQLQFGNEWINYSQEYYKIKITQEGIYRISYSTLVNSGLPVGATFNPKKLQLFNLGKEQPIFISGEEDSTFDQGDYIEFYGKKNDGSTDIPLYRTPEEQPHTFFSLYTDTNAYFLTWNSAVYGKRLGSFINTNYANFTPEPYFMHTSNNIFLEAYFEGPIYSTYGILSEYTEGEGWLGNFFKKGQTQNRDISTPYAYTPGPSPTVQLLWFGQSDVDITGTQTKNHHSVVRVSPNMTSYRQLIDTSFKGYAMNRKNFTLLNSDIGNATTRFQFSIINDLGLVADNQNIGGVFLAYARQFNLGNTSKFSFNLTGVVNGNESYINFANYASAKVNPIIYDITNGLRIGGSLSGNDLKVIIPNSGSKKQVFICDTTDIISILGIEKMQFVDYKIANNNFDYLIITHDQLLTSAADYAVYRSSTGFKPIVVTTNQLYNQFYYGIHHPMALRNFCSYALEKSMTAPKYLLLLGKGQLHYLVRSDALGYSYDLVPTMGSPASDYMITSGLKGTYLEPAIPTGRIPAITNADVTNYLNKLKEYDALPSSLWQKNILHLAGGRNTVENNLFANYLNSYKKIIEGPKVGGNVKLYSKDQAVSVSTGLKTYIQKDIADGIGMLTYFGHGASDILEIDFGGPEEISNKGKYTIMMFSGCLLGNSFTKGSLGEKFILYPNGGAVGWISNSGYGFTGELDLFNTKYYQNTCIKNYNKGIGDILKQSIADYQDVVPGNIYNNINSRQFAYEGDPALRFYFKSQPDFFISNLFVATSNVTSLSDSFRVAVVISNSGEALTDTINISLKRKLPDNSIIIIPSKRLRAAFNSDTIYFNIQSKDLKTGGINQFEAFVDASFEITESNETNNGFNLQYLMASEGAQIIDPANYSIVGKKPIKLKAQSSSIDGLSHAFVFEIDTNSNFNSPLKARSPLISSSFIATWEPAIALIDSTVYYWKVKLANSGNLDAWQKSSFLFIENSRGGWAQKHFQQFDKIQCSSITLDTTQRRFNFSRKTSSFYSLTTFGQNGSSVRTHNQNYWPTRYGTILDGISIISYNPDNEVRYNYPSQFNLAVQVPDPFASGNAGTVTIKQSGTYFFNTNNVGNVNYQAIRDSLRNHINRIPLGNYIFLHNGRNTGVENWDTALVNCFKSIGATKIAFIKEGWPYYLMTRKNRMPDDVIYEQTADTINGISGPLLAQKLEKFTQMFPLTTNGTITSEWINGASKWNSAYIWNSGGDTKQDSFSYDIIGLDKQQKEVVLYSGIKSDSFDIRNISDTFYSAIKFAIHYSDDSLRTSLQLKHWMVTFDALPEASVNTSSNYYFYKDTLQEGDSVHFQLAFQNISEYNMDSIDVIVKCIDNQNQEDTIVRRRMPPLAAGDTLILSHSFSTLGMGGANKLQLIFNPGILPEKSYSNNIYQKNFFVIKDKINPLLDVTFDGIHIINNEIVSPTPLILISAIDENKLRLLDDTQCFSLYLRPPGGNLNRIALNSREIKFKAADSLSNKAIIEFRPSYLADGNYEFSTNVTDASGNKAGINDYIINFEVTGTASITNFSPYPNPVNNALRFMFSLTGPNIPEDIQIQISTIDGKLIKTISKVALGPIHIGNNITAVVWNGTNENGDKLANGVYLYRVFISDKRNTFLHKKSTIDAYFKSQDKDINKNMGKIYLIR